MWDDWGSSDWMGDGGYSDWGGGDSYDYGGGDSGDQSYSSSDYGSYDYGGGDSVDQSYSSADNTGEYDYGGGDSGDQSYSAPDEFNGERSYDEAVAQAPYEQGTSDTGESGASTMSSIGSTLFNGAKDLLTGKAFGGGIIGALVGSVASGLLLNTVIKALTPEAKTNSNNNSSGAAPDKGQLLQIPPGQDIYIPVLYGTTTIGGIVTDVVQSNSNELMTYAVTLCECTGTVLSTGLPSQFTFNQIYINDNIVGFQSNGVTVASLSDRSGNTDTKLAGLVKIYCYAGGSSSAYQVAPAGTSITPVNAWDVVPGWTSNCTMSNLVFFIVQVTYNLAAGTTGIPTMTVQLTNSMTKPGDVLCDYMTNTVYGGGIDPSEIAV